MTTSKKREEVHKKQNNLDYRTDEDEDIPNKMIKSSSTSSSPLEFGRFCGQMSVSVSQKKIQLVLFIRMFAILIFYPISFELRFVVLLISAKQITSV